MPMSVPLCFREEAENDSAPLEVDRVRSSWESEGAGLRLWSRVRDEEDEGRTAEEASLPFRCCAAGPSLKMWTVSVAEETQRREEVVLKDML